MVRQYWAALRALLVFTVILGFGYPLLVWLVAWLPGLHDKAQGSMVDAGGKPVGSSLIGQLYLDAAGRPLPQYFQGRPSAAGAGYDPLSSGGSNLGPESIVDIPADPAKLAAGASAADAGFRPSLLTQVCSRSAAVARFEGLDQAGGSRPFCTPGGVGAVLSVIGPRDPRGNVAHPVRVVSVNEPCAAGRQPFLDRYEGVPAQCATFGENYSLGQIVPIRGAAPEVPGVPPDAVTASGSGLDPDISPAYAELQIPRVARARHASQDQIRALVAQTESGPALGIFGQASVDVLRLNLELDRRYPV
ncbi:potassium-transporting ATPase subunit C [Mycobacterium ostraviense]|uniref:Potassium-transporting ATPase KdpC subunit n=1 Tax=Mycobacterium ostraviense TaxID=2738409 RepID=A0A162FSR7_9MYCO|nr:potassium-transporting ATPase subunit C [Mycobacterium ostraviense]KZS68206.1 K+-transporting ATPase subunit C [Mycobacterium ostraviense]UGT92406.1 potassium-transporting ATPase subunit C [Mycobacterium ostraviense]